MKYIFYIILFVGIFANILISRFGLAYKVSKIDCSKLFLTNSNMFYFTNITLFILSIVLSLVLGTNILVVLISYLLSYFLGRQLFWIHIKKDYTKIQQSDNPIMDENGRKYSVDEIINTFKERYTGEKRIKELLKK